MEIPTVLAVINLIGLLTIAAIVLLRKQQSGSVDVSKDLQLHRDELRSAIASNHDIV